MSAAGRLFTSALDKIMTGKIKWGNGTNKVMCALFTSGLAVGTGDLLYTASTYDESDIKDYEVDDSGTGYVTGGQELTFDNVVSHEWYEGDTNNGNDIGGYFLARADTITFESLTTNDIRYAILYQNDGGINGGINNLIGVINFGTTYGPNNQNLVISWAATSNSETTQGKDETAIIAILVDGQTTAP